MRRLVTGTDAAGRSCVVEEGALAFAAVEGMEAFRPAVVYATEKSPPPPRPEGNAPFFDLGVAPGLASWIVVEYAPNAEFMTHHTDSIDLDTLLSGRVELLLDDGPHALEPG